MARSKAKSNKKKKPEEDSGPESLAEDEYFVGASLDAASP